MVTHSLNNECEHLQSAFHPMIIDYINDWSWNRKETIVQNYMGDAKRLWQVIHFLTSISLSLGLSSYKQCQLYSIQIQCAKYKLKVRCIIHILADTFKQYLAYTSQQVVLIYILISIMVVSPIHCNQVYF